MGPTSPSLVALVEGIGGRVLPIFLTQTLKASGSVLGLVEGVAGATQNIVQGFSGLPSDKLERYRPYQRRAA